MVCIVKSFPVRKSADVSRYDFGRCCTDSTGDGETNLNSTQLFSCKVNQSSLYTGYIKEAATYINFCALKIVRIYDHAYTATNLNIDHARVLNDQLLNRLCIKYTLSIIKKSLSSAWMFLAILSIYALDV